MTVVAAPTRLGLKFKKGETCEQVFQIKAKGSVEAAGQKMPLDMSIRMGMASEVLDVKPDGAVAAAWIFKEFKMSGAPGMPGEMDLSQMLGLSDKPIHLTFDQKGRVLNAEGLDQLSSTGMPGNMMNSPSGFDYPYLPDSPVDIGETWQDQGDTSLPGSSTKSQRMRDYVLRGLREADGLQVAVIGVKETSTVKDATTTTKAQMGMNAEVTTHINSMTMEQEGEMLLDIGQGRLLGAQISMKLDQDASLSVGGQGQSFPMKTQMDMRITQVCNYGDKETPDLSALYTKQETPVDKKAKAEAPGTSPQPASVASRLAQVEKDMRTLARALEMFSIDNNSYPLTLDGRTIDKTGIKTGDGESGRILRLTAPVAYISQIPADPFDPQGNSYRYWSDGKSYVLVSNGPDQKPDYDERLYKGQRLIELKDSAFDPAQGDESPGDIIQVGP
jgi:hypothetical protein